MVGVCSQQGCRGLSHTPLLVFVFVSVLPSMGINFLYQIVSAGHNLTQPITMGPASHPWTGTSETINPMELVTSGTCYNQLSPAGCHSRLELDNPRHNCNRTPSCVKWGSFTALGRANWAMRVKHPAEHGPPRAGPPSVTAYWIPSELIESSRTKQRGSNIYLMSPNFTLSSGYQVGVRSVYLTPLRLAAQRFLPAASDPHARPCAGLTLRCCLLSSCRHSSS